jgi:hypothetical protein
VTRPARLPKGAVDASRLPRASPGRAALARAGDRVAVRFDLDPEIRQDRRRPETAWYPGTVMQRNPDGSLLVDYPDIEHRDGTLVSAEAVRDGSVAWVEDAAAFAQRDAQRAARRLRLEPKDLKGGNSAMLVGKGVAVRVAQRGRRGQINFREAGWEHGTVESVEPLLVRYPTRRPEAVETEAEWLRESFEDAEWERLVQLRLLRRLRKLAAVAPGLQPTLQAEIDAFRALEHS